MSNISELTKFSEELKDSIKQSPKNNYIMNMQTFMMVNEHGQPFKQNIGTTRMAIKEHGQPFKLSIPEDCKISTNMAIKEHGQPYNIPKKIGFTDMVREVHGQPYKANYMLLQSNEKNTDFKPYNSSDNYYKY